MEVNPADSVDEYGAAAMGKNGTVICSIRKLVPQKGRDCGFGSLGHASQKIIE